jgi:putative hydrolase of the HAD superfamily
MLQTIRESGKKLYLLSNAQRIFTEYEMKALGIFKYFDGIFISSDFSFKKPDVRFFEKLLDTYEISKASAIMVGNDGICDIKGAKDAGLHTLYIHSNISPKEELPDADYVLEEMDMQRVTEILMQE